MSKRKLGEAALLDTKRFSIPPPRLPATVTSPGYIPYSHHAGVWQAPWQQLPQDVSPVSSYALPYQYSSDDYNTYRYPQSGHIGSGQNNQGSSISPGQYRDAGDGSWKNSGWGYNRDRHCNQHRGRGQNNRFNRNSRGVRVGGHNRYNGNSPGLSRTSSSTSLSHSISPSSRQGPTFSNHDVPPSSFITDERNESLNRNRLSDLQTNAQITVPSKSDTSKFVGSKYDSLNKSVSKLVEPKSTESKLIEPKSTESNLVEPKSVSPKFSKCDELKPITSNSVDPKYVERKSIQSNSEVSKSVTCIKHKSVTSKSGELKSVTKKNGERKYVSSKHLSPKSREQKSGLSKSTEQKSSASKSVESKSSELKSVEPKSTEPKSVESNSTEVSSVDAKSATSKSVEPMSVAPKSGETKSVPPKSETSSLTKPKSGTLKSFKFYEPKSVQLQAGDSKRSTSKSVTLKSATLKSISLKSAPQIKVKSKYSKSSKKKGKRELAVRALEAEMECSRPQKVKLLKLKFPDPELNPDIVKKYDKDIETVHFDQPSTPRYCFVQLVEGADLDIVGKRIEQIQFGNGRVCVERQDPNVELEFGPEGVDPYTLYIGNLPISISKDAIREKFPASLSIEFGIKHCSLTTRYALVKFYTVDDAISSFKEMHDLVINSQRITVKFHRRQDNFRHSGQTHRPSYSVPTPSVSNQIRPGLKPCLETAQPSIKIPVQNRATNVVKNERIMVPAPMKIKIEPLEQEEVNHKSVEILNKRDDQSCTVGSVGTTHVKREVSLFHKEKLPNMDIHVGEVLTEQAHVQVEVKLEPAEEVIFKDEGMDEPAIELNTEEEDEEDDESEQLFEDEEEDVMSIMPIEEEEDDDDFDEDLPGDDKEEDDDFMSVGADDDDDDWLKKLSLPPTLANKKKQ